ncbi:MAG: hypothetical protein JKX67_12175 [Colwellia sp.]|nr:hypothetical protein [Colwellia sp.]
MILWDRLNLSQKFTASQLGRFGYGLSFVRHIKSGSLAIMVVGDNIATINDDGDVDTAPSISLRP